MGSLPLPGRTRDVGRRAGAPSPRGSWPGCSDGAPRSSPLTESLALSARRHRSAPPRRRCSPAACWSSLFVARTGSHPSSGMEPEGRMGTRGVTSFCVTSGRRSAVFLGVACNRQGVCVTAEFPQIKVHLVFAWHSGGRFRVTPPRSFVIYKYWVPPKYSLLQVVRLFNIFVR